MAWREELHPRDARGRFAPKGARPAVSITKTLADLWNASDEDLADVFHRLSSTKRLNKRNLAAIDAELARRDGAPDLTAPDDTPEQVHIDQLVMRGYSYAEAYAEAYGTSSRGVERDQAAALVDRRKGETLETARRRAYAEMVAVQSLQAEEATRGNLTSKRCPHVDAAALWSGPAARARKCASEELLRWWEDNGGASDLHRVSGPAGRDRQRPAGGGTGPARWVGKGLRDMTTVDRRDIARAEAFGRVAGKGGCGLQSCPYEANGSPEQRVLAARWVRAYLAHGGAVAVDYDDGTSQHAVQTRSGRLRVTVTRPRHVATDQVPPESA